MASQIQVLRDAGKIAALRYIDELLAGKLTMPNLAPAAKAVLQDMRVHVQAAIERLDNGRRDGGARRVSVTRLFVYGTLKRGESNHRIVEGCRFVGEAIATGFELVSLGSFPAMRPATVPTRLRVRGEVYEVDEAVLARTDSLEGHPSWYRRCGIAVEIEGVSRYVEAYVMLNADGPVVQDGNWRGNHG